MVEVGKIKGVITIEGLDKASRDLTAFDNKMKQTASSADGSARKVSGSFKGLGSVFSGVASVAGGNVLTGILSKIAGTMDETTKIGVDYAKQIENASLAFGQLTGSSKTAADHIKDLQQIALKTPFQFQDVVNASLKLQAFGYNAEQVTKMLPTLSDTASLAAAGTGQFKESLDGVILALGQMRAKGKVSLEEINQLTERGVPALDILAKKLGRTTAETTKLIETGRIKGGAASDLLVEGFQQKYGGLSDKLSQTLAGKESNYEDLFQQRAAVSAAAFVAEYNKRLDEALNNPGASASDMKINETLNKGKDYLAYVGQGVTDNKFGKAVGDTAKSLSGIDGKQAEDKIAGFAVSIIKGVTGAWEQVSQIGAKVAGDSGKAMGEAVTKTTKDTLGIHSPSEVFKGIGDDSATGFGMGMNEGLKKWAKQIEADGGAEFLKAVEEMAARLKTDPRYIMNVMAFESGLNPAKKNPNSSATGLIQFMNSTASGLGTTTKELGSMNAIEQLKYVEAYFKQFQGLLKTQEGVYSAVLAGKAINDPNAVLFRDAKGKAGANYRANSALDKDASGTVTVREAAAQAYKQGFLSSVMDGTKPMLEELTKINLTLADLRSLATGSKGVAGLGKYIDSQSKVKGLGKYIGGAGGGDSFNALLDRINPTNSIPGGKFYNGTISAGSGLVPYSTDKVSGGLNARSFPDLPKPLLDSAKAMATLKGEVNQLNPSIIKQGEVTKATAAQIQAALGSTFAEKTKALGERTGQLIDETLTSLITGEVKIGEALRNLAKGFLRDFFSTMQEQIFQSLTGEKSAGALIGKLLGNLLGSFLGGIFGGKKASGGDVLSGKTYLIGEEGPELMTVGGNGGFVTSNRTAKELVQGSVGSGMVNHFNITIQAPDRATGRETAQQAALKATQQLEYTMRRRGQ